MSRSNQVRRAKESRFLVLALMVVGGFLLIIAGLLRLQVARHEEFRRLAEENQVRLEVLRAPRGAIFDRNGELLADSQPSFDIVFRPFPAESTQSIRATLGIEWIARVGAIVGVDTATVRELVRLANRSGQSALLRRGAPFAVMAAVEESRGELPGIEVNIQPRRNYPHGTLGSHLLGYAAQISEAELDSLGPRGYRLGDLIGRTGVERAYEDILRGRDGAEYVVVNAMGRRVATFSGGPGRRPPEPGHDLVLTIDLRVQQALEEVMAEVGRGAAVAIDPRDGGILGLVSRPAFDPNEFSFGISHARWKELSAGGDNPLLNRALQGTYPPGSTFKIVTMAAALESGVARASTHLPAACFGSYTYGGRTFRCWKPAGHGSLDFYGAIEHSCDVYFYQIGPRLGIPRLAEAAKAMGLGERTGVDLPQERRGLIPDMAWYDKRWGVGRYPKGTMLNLAIGQGELLVTPIQLALMAAQVGRDGQALRPHVIRRVTGVNWKPEKPNHPGFAVGGPTWKVVRDGLQRVVASGTGGAARVPGYAVAGKTGTAQNPHGNDHALFVCYAPAESPTIAMAFVVENSGHGGSVAAPKAGTVLRRLFLPDSLQDARTVRLRPDTTQAVAGD